MKNVKVTQLTKGLSTIYFLNINNMQVSDKEKLQKILTMLKGAEYLLMEIVSSDNVVFANMTEEEQSSKKAQKIVEESILIENNIFIIKDVIEDITKAISL